ncbi:MAG: TolC family protein, partial [Anaerohalosphaera sp.]|nr:TolC family protein [Anaerohalosphaera sp.]
MNKTKVALIILSNGFFLTVFCGCDSSTHQTPEVPQQKLRQIENFKPQQNTVEVTEEKISPPTPTEEMELTLESCRATALKHNLDLKAQLIKPTIQAEQLNQERARFEWIFNAGMSKSIGDSELLYSTSGSQSENRSTNLGVQMPLQTGGEINFNLVDNHVETDRSDSALSESYSDALTFSISQPLLKGAGKNNYNSYMIRLAQYDSHIVDAQTKLQVISVLAAVERTYWRLYAARRQLQLRKEEYELANAQLDRAKHFVEVGELPKIEILRAEAGLAQTLQAIITTENLVRQKQRELKQALNMPGLDIDSQTKIITMTPPDPVDYDFDTEGLIAAATENRMDMLELELQLAQNTTRLDYLKNQTLPALSVDYMYRINGLGIKRRDSFDGIWDKNYEDHRFGINLQIPLGNKAAKSALLQAKYRRMQTLTTKQGKITMIELEVLAASDRAKAAWQQILASRQSAILQGQVYEAEIRQFKTGLRTSTDVLEAQATLANAQSIEIAALVEYQEALVDMAEATGTVLGAAKIQWQPET